MTLYERGYKRGFREGLHHQGQDGITGVLEAVVEVMPSGYDSQPEFRRGVIDGVRDGISGVFPAFAS